ncbi:hypothetical protein ACFOZ5_13625 [Marinobacter lacisalsi]|uniref:Uncharacterized protein n=1 Tax=Marinobacter lacisalsi TaxID=475979 RepID=A0ABV8QLV5_9GAMM
MKKLLQWAAAGLILCSGIANAGYITLDEVALDDIFAQPSLGIPGGVDVRVNPYQEVVRPDLITIDSFIEVFDLWNSTPYDFPAIDLYL